MLIDGSYHAVLPDQGGGPLPAVVFLHGAGSNGTEVLRNASLVRAFQERGYAVLAPTGARQFGEGSGRSWNFLPGWDGRDEADFLRRVIRDAGERFGIDTNLVLLAGFSAGAFMVNYLACETPDAFAAYAPVAGGFWRPLPVACAGPVRLFHTHGWKDAIVPIEGRFLANKSFQQGDIFAGMELWRSANACADERPTVYSETGPFLRRAWSDCAPAGALEFALFAGGHTIPEGWANMVLDWFEAKMPD
jgi:polyhydroxybutyrate depolymerase